MDMGQMIAVVQQMPAVQDVAAGNEVVGQMEQSSPFAGVLQGVITPNIEQEQLMAQNASQETPDWERISQMQLDAVAALLACSSNATSVVTPETTDVISQKVAVDVRQQSEDSEELKNVTSNLNETQTVQMFAQLQGKMPDVAVMPAVQGQQEGPQASRSIDAQESSMSVNAVITSAASGTMVQVVSEKIETGPVAIQPSVRMADTVVAQVKPGTGRPSRSGNNLTGMIDRFETTGELQQFSGKVTEEAIPTQFNMETVVTEGGKTVMPVEQNRSRLDVVQSATVLEKQAFRIENRLIQSVEVPRSQPQVVKSVNTAVDADLTVKMLAPSSPVQKSTSLVVGTENRVLQLETPEQPDTVAQRSIALPEAHITQTPRPVESQVAAQVATQVQLQSAKQTVSQADLKDVKNVVEPQLSTATNLVEVSVSPSETAAPHVIQQKVRTSTPLVSAAAVAVAEVMPESNSVRINLREVVGSQNMETVDPVSNIVTAATSEKHFGSDGESLGQNMSGNAQPNILQQQVKSEGPAVVGTVAGTDANNTSRASQSAEPVVQQVRERLVNHIAKPGNEQVVLRLSPEHLGELKVNLNMEGQRLRVEIVAENSTVRDSLLQNTDLLKESLSRQNIKMESFDVTTGGNSMSDNSRGQGEWRELAQRRQQNLWMPEGGYRMAKQAAPAVAAYQTKSQHTMVDVHF